MSPRNILRALTTRRKTNTRRPRRQRLGAEPLESRAMLSTVPFLTDPALPTVTVFTAQGRYGNNALNGDWEVGLTRKTNDPIDSQAHRRWANLNQTAQPSSQQTVQPEPFSFTVKRDLAATFTVGGTKVAFGYGGQSTANQPNAIKIWAKASTANSGLTIDNLKLTTPGMAVPMEFPGASIAVSRSSGPDFQQLVIAGVDFTSGSGPAVELTGNVLMSFGAPAPRGSSLQFHVMAVYVPPVDLDVDSDNDGTFIRSAFEELEEDAGVVADSDTPTKPGLIVPVGGPRAEMVVEVPAGRTATLALSQGAERVQVYAQPTGGAPLGFPLALANPAVRGSTTFTYWIDAVAPSASMADIAFTLTTSDAGPASSDTVRATAYLLDLDVNSDNTAQLDRSKLEEQIEAEATKPGVIVPVGGARVPLVVELSAGASAQLTLRSGDDKVLLFDEEVNGNQALRSGTARLTAAAGTDSTIWTFWIEAYHPSVQMADIVFTLSPQGPDSLSGLVEMIVATAAEVDVVIDDLAPEIEDGSGAVVWRNSDFSRKLPHPDAELDEEGLPHYVPDYRDSAKIDSLYATQFTRAVAIFPSVLSTYFSYQFDVSAVSSVVLWTRAAWSGFVAADDGWFKIPSGIKVMPVPAGLSSIDIWIEGLTSTEASQHTLGFKAVSSSVTSPAVAYLADDVRFRVVDVGIAVDGNRDNKIDFADSYDSLLTFWINDDHEKRIGRNEWAEDASANLATHDNDDGEIQSKRDFEDFAALRLGVDPVLYDNAGYFVRSRDSDDLPQALKPLVRYELKVSNDATRLRLFRQAGPNPNSHVTDKDHATRQLTFPFSRNIEARDGAPDDSTISNTVLQSAITNVDGERPRYLFEGVGEPGKVVLTFKVTITYPHGASNSGFMRTTTREQAVTLDLHKFEDFYTRMRIPYNAGAIDDRIERYKNGDTELPHFPDARRVGRSKIESAPFLSGTDTAVFVHGWNMTDGTQDNSPDTDWKKAFTETAFKRMYWQGYRGNLFAFDWPTFADSEGPFPARVETFNLTFNASEYQAWRSGQALMHYLASIKSPTGRTHLFGHSMGNIVAAEAMRQWVANGHPDALVTTYIAMQAAISAGTYGSDTQGARVGWGWGDGQPELESKTDLYRHWPSGDGDEGDDYYMAGTQSAAGSWVNMYNPVDAATAGRLVWPSNNWAKGGVVQGTVWPWRYAWFPDDGYSRGHWKIIEQGILWAPRYWWESEQDLDPGLSLPADEGELPEPGPSAYETMAFLARSESMPVGTMSMADEGDGRFAANFDLNHLGLAEEFSDTWPGHSFQFYFDAVTTVRFWEKVREQTGFRSTLS
jgi:hypothetical protein